MNKIMTNVLRFAAVLLVLYAVPAQAAETSIKVYGAQAQADLSGLPAAAATFNYNYCAITSGANPVCSLSPLTWSRIADDGNGNVKNPGDGTMNAQGWMLADQYIQISNVQVNDPGWILDIFTDNTDFQNGQANPLLNLSGPLVAAGGSLNGLVSSDGNLLIPLSWKATFSTITNFLDPTQWPNFDEDVTGTGCHPGSAGFCDFATHYMLDLRDTKPVLTGNQFTWWQYVTDPTQKVLAAQYQSPLSSQGAGTGDFYRSPYSTLSGIGTVPIYIAAKFAPGTIREQYKTTIYMEITHL
jgi:hypothetical protein